jgi:ribosomal protein L32E
MRQPVEGRRKQEGTMRAVTVYRLDYGSNTRYRTRHPIGSVLELRKTERVNNYNDLLRLARRLFALNTADAVHIVIDVGQARREILLELTRDCSVG